MPDRLGQYRIERQIGRGGMGTVFEAVHEPTGRRVALKLLPPELAREEAFVSRFRREVQTLAALDHPGIVKILDVGVSGTAGVTEAGTDRSALDLEATGDTLDLSSSGPAFHYYAMEYVDGPSLEAVLQRKGRIEPLQVCALAVELCAALEHAHQRGIIHRDLKPANILLDREGRAHLTDFGIAKVIEATRMTTTGGIVGTAEYMSPEQAEGRSVDRRTDLYGLGAVLYRALTGRVPFEGKTALEVLQQHRFAVFESPRELNPAIPGPLSALVEQMLEKVPARRPASAGVVRRELEAVRRMLETGGGELAKILFDRTGERAQAPEREVGRRGPYLRAAAYLAACAAVVVAALWLSRPPSEAGLIEDGRRALEESEQEFAAGRLGLAAEKTLDAMAYLHEVMERHPGGAAAAATQPLHEEAARRFEVWHKQRLAKLEGFGREMAQELLGRTSIELPESAVTAGELALARAMRDRMDGRLDEAKRKFEAVAVIFARQEPAIAASAERQGRALGPPGTEGAGGPPATTSLPSRPASSRAAPSNGERGRAD